jgi:outer membrane protein OmpA-like peptidoglycan-associated protein
MSLRTVTTWSAVALLAAAPLGAQSPISVDVGTFGSFTRFDRSLFIDNGVGFGGRIGVGFAAAGRPLRVEAELARTGSEQNGISVAYSPSRLRLVYPAPLSGGRMTLLLGAGGVRSSYSSDATSVVDFGMSGLAALQLRLAERVALRIDGTMDYMASPSNEAANMPSNWNGAVAIGMSMPLDFARRTRRDAEPAATPAPAPVPVSAPVLAPAPADPATTDTDRDGVVDARDRCAGTTPGTAVDGAGCALPTDSDQDGVADPSDRCMGTPAGTRVDVSGCPVESDTDGDAVVDSRDRCPATPAGTTVDGTGCPPLFERARTVTLRGVTFQSGRAELTASSLAVLDKVAAQLLESPEVRIEVAGHTDAVGTRTGNIRLSLQRAEAVRAYLVSQGVTTDRLVARGYGPDQPAGSNATPDGRAMNRRVELRRVD